MKTASKYLLSLWVLRPEKALVPVEYSYNSTIPMGRTAYTEI